MSVINYEIDRPYDILTYVGNLRQYTQNLETSKGELNTHKTRLASAWVDNGETREEYFKTYQKNVENLDALINALEGLGDMLSTLAYESIREQNNG